METTIQVQRMLLVNLVELVSFAAEKKGKPLSNSEIRRRIRDGAVYVNNEKKMDHEENMMCGGEHVIVRWGKRGNTAVIAPSPWETLTIEAEERDGKTICTTENLVHNLVK